MKNQVEAVDQTPQFKLNDIEYHVYDEEIKAFLENCNGFMNVNKNGFDVMIREICDHLIDEADSETPAKELKDQLKFMREIDFLLKSLCTK